MTDALIFSRSWRNIAPCLPWSRRVLLERWSILAQILIVGF